jgi:hypothetical protein
LFESKKEYEKAKKVVRELLYSMGTRRTGQDWDRVLKGSERHLESPTQMLTANGGVAGNLFRVKPGRANQIISQRKNSDHLIR